MSDGIRFNVFHEGLPIGWVGVNIEVGEKRLTLYVHKESEVWSFIKPFMLDDLHKQGELSDYTDESTKPPIDIRGVTTNLIVDIIQAVRQYKPPTEESSQ